MCCPAWHSLLPAYVLPPPYIGQLATWQLRGTHADRILCLRAGSHVQLPMTP
jgi:hypothetical protein